MDLGLYGVMGKILAWQKLLSVTKSGCQCAIAPSSQAAVMPLKELERHERGLLHLESGGVGFQKAGDKQH
jgi:hypothetical protein